MNRMNDYISRHGVIKAVDKFFPADPMKSDYTQGITVGLALATRCIEEFSQETDEYSQGLVKDLISRQDAKDVVDMELDAIDHVPEWVYDRLLTALDKVPSAQPEQRWIPCSERLPRRGQEVICQCRANMIKVLKLDACGDWYQDAEHCYMSGFVIAWMPLPAQYIPEGDDKHEG